jgi:DNA modification methylase
MTPNTIIQGDALTVLRTLPDNSIDCCVTSPPYLGLRDYGTGTWTGGNPDCKHSEREECGFENSKQASNRGSAKNLPKKICKKCGAVRVDNQIGMEGTPEEYRDRLLEVFTEVHRVLKPEGTLWLNIGDSYNGSGGAGGDYGKGGLKEGQPKYPGRKIQGLKSKDLIGIPWMIAFALRDAGWYLRKDIIWQKVNCMPDSVKDRCTNSHEYLFHFSKSAKYYYDYEAIMEPAAYDGRKDTFYKGGAKDMAGGAHERWMVKNGVYMRNKRSVWKVNTKPYPEAHFATYPAELIVPCIKAGCPEGGIVLDPFMGSGTTAVVARKLNRNFVGIELNPEYIKLAERRLREELGIFL